MGAAAEIGFIADLRWADVPAPVRERVGFLLADLAAVCVAGRPAPASRMAADYASLVHPGDAATLLYDGRRVGAVGAAWANGALANVLDLDDGHRLTKGHPGAMIVPAAMAAAQHADAGVEDFLAAVVVGYEIAIRAGIALHARDDSYHASGAWGGLGAAAVASRLIGLTPEQTRHAIGLSEYHAPIAPIMRSVAQPAMTKDACAWGAAVGVGSALLAAGGFTSVGSEFLAAGANDLGARWRLEELYVKAYPCCRWSQGAIRAAISAAAGRPPAPDEVQRIVIRTFKAADGLAKVAPTTTEEAQYSLVWPVAVVLARGDFTVADVLGGWDDPEVAALASRTEVRVDPELTAAFPARRLTGVEVLLRSGERLSAGPLEALGEPDDPAWQDVVAGKVATLIDPLHDLSDPPSTGLRGFGASELLGLACAAIPSGTHA